MTEDRDKTVEILAAILDKINAPEFNLRAVMETILDYILERTHAEMGSILLTDDSENVLRLVAAQGDRRALENKEHIYPIDKGIQSIVFRTGKPYVSNDVSGDENYIKVWEGVGSELAVPIIARGEVLGILSLDSAHDFRLDDNAVELATVFAGQVATAIGMERLRDIDEVRRAERELLAKETCFVLMPFSEPFNKYFTAVIAPAIEASGLRPLRADSMFGPASVMKDIWENIKKAKLLLGELTTRNPNVMYELGLAHAMEKPVVLLTQNIDDVPFDLRSIRCIVYDTTNPDWANKLREEIRKYVQAVLREGKQKKRFRAFSRR